MESFRGNDSFVLQREVVSEDYAGRGSVTKANFTCGYVVHRSSDDDVPIGFHLPEDLTFFAHAIAHKIYIACDASIDGLVRRFTSNLVSDGRDGRLDALEQPCEVAIFQLSIGSLHGSTLRVTEDQNSFFLRIYTRILENQGYRH